MLYFELDFQRRRVKRSGSKLNLPFNLSTRYLNPESWQVLKEQRQETISLISFRVAHPIYSLGKGRSTNFHDAPRIGHDVRTVRFSQLPSILTANGPGSHQTDQQVR